MRHLAVIVALFRSLGLIRLIGLLALVATLLLVRDGVLLARDAKPEARSADPAGPIFTLAEAPAEPARPPVEAAPIVAVNPPRAPTPTAAPTVSPALSAPPVADLQATPPPPDPRLPVWVSNRVETGLWSGPTDGTLFTKLAPNTLFRVIEQQAGRFRVFYAGDRLNHPPGEAWVDAADLAPAPWPRFVRLRGVGSIITRPSLDGQPLITLRAGDYLEVVGEFRGSWARVYYLGDGRQAAVEGWVEASPVAAIPGADVASSFALTRDLITNGGGPSVWLPVPYRSQMDGSSYALANCGPTTAGMVLESFGFKVSQPVLRREVLGLQPSEDCDDCGVYIQNLAEVIARRGLKIGGLREDDPEAFHRWTIDEVRAELRAGRPVVPQVFYRGLPGRATSGYWGDHFVVLTGILGDRFLFNDPIDVEGPGYSRLISAQALDKAMAASDYPYAAFSVGR